VEDDELRQKRVGELGPTFSYGSGKWRCRLARHLEVHGALGMRKVFTGGWLEKGRNIESL